MFFLKDRLWFHLWTFAERARSVAEKGIFFKKGTISIETCCIIGWWFLSVPGMLGGCRAPHRAAARPWLREVSCSSRWSLDWSFRSGGSSPGYERARRRDLWSGLPGFCYSLQCRSGIGFQFSLFLTRPWCYSDGSCTYDLFIRKLRNQAVLQTDGSFRRWILETEKKYLLILVQPLMIRSSKSCI